MDDGPERWETSRNSHLTRSLFEPLFAPLANLSAPTHNLCNSIRSTDIGIVKLQQATMFATRAASALAKRAPVRAFTKARPFTSSVSRCT